MTIAWDEHKPPELDLIKDCVHCGFCLPTCPSYQVLENENDSPRGRIVLMRIGHDEGAEVSPEMTEHFDNCLGCMACVTACPSGVQYDRLIEQTRPQIERHGARTRAERAHRRMIFELFTHPGRMRALAPLMALQDKLGVKDRLGERIKQPHLRAMLRLAPPVKLRSAVRRLPEVVPAQGTRKGRVGFMQGCVQRAFFGDVNAATVRVLAAEGWEVHSPRQPRCCGALMMHSGVEEPAKELARATIAAHEDFDYVAVNVSGCGSSMKEYDHLLSDDPEWADRAKAFVAKTRDVHELLGGGRGAAGRAPPDPARGSPTTTPATSRTRRRCAPSRASCCARSPAWSSSSPPTGRSAAARPASTTWSSPSPPPSSASARPPTWPRPARRRSPPPTRAARSRSRPTSSGRSRSITR